MIQFSEYFQLAELALAAYAENLVSGDPSELELRKAEFSINQACNFTDTYYVMIQYTDVTGRKSVV